MCLRFVCSRNILFFTLFYSFCWRCIFFFLLSNKTIQNKSRGFSLVTSNFQSVTSISIYVLFSWIYSAPDLSGHSLWIFIHFLNNSHSIWFVSKEFTQNKRIWSKNGKHAYKKTVKSIHVLCEPCNAKALNESVSLWTQRMPATD